MKDVKRDFQERLDEINLYFSFLEKVILKEGTLLYADGTSENIDATLVKTLRANGFLLIYNLVESCIKKAIEEIYISMRRDNVEYDNIKEGIRKEIINYLRSSKTGTDSFVSSVNNIAEDIIEHCFSAETLFSGNVDARKIREIAKKYGFSTHTNTARTKSGAKLLTVKTRRNDLAHGVYSFQECGKEYTIQDMLEIKNEVTSYLEQILDNIEIYIDNKEFLK
jgi:hypothetical protein